MANWGDYDASWEEPQAKIPKVMGKSTMVKQEAFEKQPGETDRQAKIRMMAEQLRREAREGTAAKKPATTVSPATTVKPATTTPAALAAKRKAPEMTPAQLQQKEDEDAQKIEKFLPALEEKVQTIEDEAEKVAILAAPLAMEADDQMRELQLAAVRDTERALRATTSLLTGARNELGKRKTEVEKFAPGAKETGESEIVRLTERLDTAQAKLDEFKTVRKDHEAATAAGTLYTELAQRTTSLEIDSEKAAMMAEPIGKALDNACAADVSPTEIRETKEALRIAQATLAPTMRLLQGKISGLKGPMKTKMTELQTRVENCQSMIEKAQKQVDECQASAAVVPMMKQASERLTTVEEVVERMRETESPFLMGIETMPPEETVEVLNKMEKAAGLAQSAIADAHKYVSLKLVDVAKYGNNESVKAEMDRVKSALDMNLEKVKKFQTETQKRKRQNLVEGIKFKVEEATSAVEELKKLGAELSKAEDEKISEILEKGLEAEVAAVAAVNIARKELQDRQQDLKPLEGGGNKDKPDALKSNSEVLKTKVKVNYMEAELVKFRKIAKDFEEKAQVEKSLGDVLRHLEEAEVEVTDLEAASLVWPKGEKPPDGEEKRIVTVQGKLSSTTVAVERKLQSAQGLELKQLRAVFGRLQRTQWKLDRIKEKIRELTRSVSQKVVKEALDVITKAEKLVATLGLTKDIAVMSDVNVLEETNAKAKEANSAVAEAQTALAEAQNSGSLGLDAKVEFARLQLRWKACERKGKAVAEAVLSRTSGLMAEAENQALDVLRGAAKVKEGVGFDSDALFKNISNGSEEISLKQFQDFFAIRAAEIDASVAETAFKKIAPYGLTERTFALALRSYFKCLKEISITAEFEVASAKKVKKLLVGELIEATGMTQKDPNLGLERVPCRCLKDGELGWATIKSQQGTTYLAAADKPYLWCVESAAMHEEQRLGSTKVRSLTPGEVVELVQGPVEDNMAADQRVRGMACHEGAQGWLQVKDKGGSVLAKQSARVFKCVEGIAMTDISDFETCNMVRRIDADEALELLPDAAFSDENGNQRKKFKACRDGKEGWITTEGSQGTIYVKPAPKHYICNQAAPLHSGLGAESAVVRVLMPGEAFAAFEEPKEVAGGEQQTAYLVKSTSGDGAEGWVFCGAASPAVTAWTTTYKVLKAVPITKGLIQNEAAETIEVVRLLEPDELLDVAEPPLEDSSTGQLRVRASARRDQVVGFVTVREGSSAESLLIKPEDETTTLTPAPSTPPGSTGTKRSAEEPTKGAGKWYKGKGKGKGKW